MASCGVFTPAPPAVTYHSVVFAVPKLLLLLQSSPCWLASALHTDALAECRLGQRHRMTTAQFCELYV